MGLPTVILPGYFAGADAYRTLEDALRDRGFPTVTVPLQRWDWIPTLGGRPVTPILQRLDQTVKQVMRESGASDINLVGHSAGGWIARIYLGDKPYQIPGSSPEKMGLWKAHPLVTTLVTLGTPHMSQERWTRRNLDFVNQTYPGAFYRNVRYVCVAGKAIFGQRQWGQWFAYSSYELTCGQGTCWGDGITPIAAAHLDGAENVVLENVRHSPKSGQLWYGSREVLSSWVPYLA